MGYYFKHEEFASQASPLEGNWKEGDTRGEEKRKEENIK